VTDSRRRTYLALGDSMSIDKYTGMPGGGAAHQLHARLGDGWRLVDRTCDGCRMGDVHTGDRADLVTLTVGGNDLLVEQERYLQEGMGRFAECHARLLAELRRRNPAACLVVGNIYAPQSPLPGPWQAGLDAANAAIAGNAAAAGARLADIRAAFDGHEDEYLCLEIEPTLEGATVIADLFYAAFTQVQ
jgi:lysophospholipase L1-like esterase